MENLCKKCFNPCRGDCDINNPKDKCEDFMDDNTNKECNEWYDLCENKGTDKGCLVCKHYRKDCPVDNASEEDCKYAIDQMYEENYGYISSDISISDNSKHCK